MALARSTSAATLTALVVLAAAFGNEGGEIDPPLELPMTIDKVGYTTSLKGAPGSRFKLKGDLTLTERALELATEDDTIVIGLDEIHVASYGKLRGDVDMDWVVLGLGRTGPVEIVGLRDGSRFGFFGDTSSLFETIRRYLRQQRAGQYAVPEGWRAWDPLHRQLSLAVPATWHEWTDELVLEKDDGCSGTLALSSQRLAGAGQGADRPVVERQALAAARSGDLPALWITIDEAGRGDACEGLSPKAIERAREEAAGHPGLGLTPESFTVEPWTIDGCTGVRLAGEGRDSTGRPVRATVRVVGKPPDRYRFTTLARPDADPAETSAVYERILDSVRFSPALRARER